MGITKFIPDYAIDFLFKTLLLGKTVQSGPKKKFTDLFPST